MTIMSPAAAIERARPIAARRSGSKVALAALKSRIDRAGLHFRDIFSGSSVRGLSEVNRGRSASCAAIWPMIGRLPRSRSPPQPKMQIRRLGLSLRRFLCQTCMRWRLEAREEHLEHAAGPAD